MTIFGFLPDLIVLDVAPTRAVVVHLRNVLSCDASALQTLQEMMEDYERRGIHVMFVKIRDSVKREFFKAGLISEANAGDKVFSKVDEAVKRAQELITREEFSSRTD
jgi:MFS superfamily sulfate permease-like transporter